MDARSVDLLRKENEELKRKLLEVMSRGQELQSSGRTKARTVKSHAGNQYLPVKKKKNGAMLVELDGWQCMRREYTLDGDTLLQTSKELESLESLPRHENILQHIAHKTEEGRLLVFTANYSRNLRDYLAQFQSKPILVQQQLINVLPSILSAILFLSRNSLVHCNISARSVYLKYDGNGTIWKAVLGDFQTVLKNNTAVTHTLRDSITKKAVDGGIYMAPELVAPGEQIATSSVDVWGYGMFMYECIFLERPYYDVPDILVPGTIAKGEIPTFPASSETDTTMRPFTFALKLCLQTAPALRPKVESLLQLMESQMAFHEQEAQPAPRSDWLSEFSTSPRHAITSSWPTRHPPSPLIDTSLDRFNFTLGEPGVTHEQALADARRVFVKHFQCSLAYKDFEVFVSGKGVASPCVVVMEKFGQSTSNDVRGGRASASSAIQFKTIIYVAEGEERMFTGAKPGSSGKEKLKTLLLNRPNLSAMSLRQVEVDAALTKSLISFEQQIRASRYKFGVVHCRQGQRTEAEMLANSTIEPEFKSFLDILGETVSLKNWSGFLGGLDSHENLDGTQSVHSVYEGLEIMYHVAPHIPPSDQQQIHRKRFIGNDVVVVVYKDADDTDNPFNPSAFVSDFNHIFVVVQAENPKLTSYRVAAAAKKGVPCFKLPSAPVFSRAELAAFLPALLILAEQNALRAPKFSSVITKMFESGLADIAMTLRGRKSLKSSKSRMSDKKSRSMIYSRANKPAATPAVITSAQSGGWRRLGDDSEEKKKIMAHLNKVMMEEDASGATLSPRQPMGGSRSANMISTSISASIANDEIALNNDVTSQRGAFTARCSQKDSQEMAGPPLARSREESSFSSLLPALRSLAMPVPPVPRASSMGAGTPLSGHSATPLSPRSSAPLSPPPARSLPSPTSPTSPSQRKLPVIVPAPANPRPIRRKPQAPGEDAVEAEVTDCAE